ncbi:unnamed protein product, partial [Meganyctiphanes norvegica]
MAPKFEFRRNRSHSDDDSSQYTWVEGIWLGILFLTYLAGFCINIAIIADKYLMDEPPDNRHLYIIFFFVPMILAGIKNIQYHARSQRREDEDQFPLLVSIILFPFSPLLRYVRAWRFGSLESEDKQYGVRFVDELLTGSVLRLFDVFLGDAPTLSLLVSSDIWGNSGTWRHTVMEGSMPINCGIQCVNWDGDYVTFFQVFAIMFLLSKMAQGITLYIIVTKRWQHIQYPNRYSSLYSNDNGDGRLNIFATLLLYLSNMFYIGSRIMGYSMVATTWGSWVYGIIGARWLLNSAWHLISVMMNDGFSAARSIVRHKKNTVRMFGMTSEGSGRQYREVPVILFLKFGMSRLCCYLLRCVFTNTRCQRNNIHLRAPWAMLVVFGIGLMLNLMYYSLCHPGNAQISIQGLLCCSPNRRDMSDNGNGDTNASPV